MIVGIFVLSELLVPVVVGPDPGVVVSALKWPVALFMTYFVVQKCNKWIVHRHLLYEDWLKSPFSAFDHSKVT